MDHQLPTGAFPQAADEKQLVEWEKSADALAQATGEVCMLPLLTRMDG